jgi:hypothetical protein
MPRLFLPAFVSLFFTSAVQGEVVRGVPLGPSLADHRRFFPRSFEQFANRPNRKAEQQERNA